MIHQSADKKWYYDNHEKKLQLQKEWRINNKEKRKQYNLLYSKKMATHWLVLSVIALGFITYLI
jgi:hypothetical protein